MITLDNFTAEIKKYNSVKYLKTVIKKLNNGEGYLTLRGKHVIFNKFLSGKAEINRNRFIKNTINGIVSFDL